MTIVEQLLQLLSQADKKPARPKERDEAIYAAVRVRGKTQTQVAAEWGLSQPRVSQIVRRVEAWRKSEEFSKEARDDRAARGRADRALDRQRLEEMYLRGIRAQDRAEQRVTSERSGERNGEPWSEKTTRDQPVNVQGLKTAMRAMELLWKLEAQQPSGPCQRTSAEKVTEAIEQLEYLRCCAISYGCVQKKESRDETKATVARLLRELVGAGTGTGAPRTTQPGLATEASTARSPLTYGQIMREDADPRTTACEVEHRPPGREESGAYDAYSPGAESDEEDVDVAAREPVLSAEKATPSARRAKRKCVDNSYIYLPVKPPAISPLTPEQKEARRALLPRMEWTHYDQHGNELPRS